MKKRKHKFFLIIILIFSLFPTGCMDRKEIDDQVYAIAIGADRGIENKIRLTVQYPLYQEEQIRTSPEAQVVGDTIVSTVEAPSILEGLDLLLTSTSRRISLVHTKIIIFSEAFAKEGIGGFLQPVARFRETRRIMQVAVCRGTAEEFIKGNTTFIGKGLAKALELKEKEADYTGLFARSSFHNFYRASLSPYSQPYTTYAGINHQTNLRTGHFGDRPPLVTEQKFLPGQIPKSGDLKNEYVGTAVFNGERMVGALDSYETRLFLMIIDEFKKGTMTIEDPNSQGDAVIFDLRPSRKPKIKASFDGDIPVIQISIFLEADVLSVQSRIPYEEAKGIEELNKLLESHIKEGAEKVISKTQDEFGTDIFGFGYKVARNFTTIQEFENYDWLSQFSKARIKVDVKSNIRRTGLMIHSSPIQYNEIKEREEE